MRQVMKIVKDLQPSYPKISFHLYSGNADDVTERLDKGLLDFGLLIQPADLSKYNYLNLPVKDVWGLIMKKDSPLARKKSVRPSDLIGLPLIISRQAIKQTLARNEFTDWFGDTFEKLNIIATINLIFNATLMVKEGVGYAFALDNLVTIDSRSDLCFRPLEPRLEAGISIVWKKHQVFSPPAHLFQRELEARFLTG